MRWRLANLIVAGAIELGILALRAAKDFTSSYTPVFGVLRDRFSGVTDQTATAVYGRVQEAYASAVSHNRLQNPESMPTVPPVDLRPTLSREYGAPPANPETGVNTMFTYVVDVTTNQMNKEGGGYHQYPITVRSPTQLNNGQLDAAARQGTADFLRLLAVEYERTGIDTNAEVTGIRVISATQSYDFPIGWTLGNE